MDIVLDKLEELNFSQPLSLRTIRNRTKINNKMINKRFMLATLHNSDKYRKVIPYKIGSGKHKLNVWEKFKKEFLLYVFNFYIL